MNYTQGKREARIFSVDEQTIGRVLSFLDEASKLEFRKTNKWVNKLVTVRGGWSDTLIAHFLPELELTDDTDDLSTGNPFSNSPFSSSPRKQLASMKNKNNRLWFSYFRSVSLLAGHAIHGTDIDTLIQALSKSLLHEFKSKP